MFLQIVHFYAAFELQQMIESQQEDEHQQSYPLQQMQRKLYVLHSQNQRLKSQRLQIDEQIQNYIKKVNDLHLRAQEIQQANEQLTKDNHELNEKWQALQIDYSKKSEEYGSLYNYIFAQRKRGFREIVLKEIELSNDLNKIQHDSDAQIIDKLKETIRLERERMTQLAEEISKLNQSLLDSTSHYQTVICGLKEENIKLVYQLKNYKESDKEEEDKSQTQDIQNYCKEMIIKTYKEEAHIYKHQLDALRREITQTKQQTSQNQQKQDKIGHHLKQSTTNNFDFQRIEEIASTNNKLQEQNEELKAKWQRLVEEISHGEQINEQYRQFLQNRDQVKVDFYKIRDLQHAMKETQRQLQIVKKQKQEQTDKLNQTKTQYKNYITFARETFYKLEYYLNAYVPTFKLIGYESFNQEEKLFFEEFKKHSAKQTRQIDQLHKQEVELKKRITELQGRDELNQLKLHNLNIAKTELMEEVKKIQILFQQKLKNQRQSNKKTAMQQANRRDSDDIDEQIQDDDIVNEQKYNSQPLQNNKQEQNQQIPLIEKCRVQALEKAVHELQQDRCELIQIIRNKEIQLAEVKSMLKTVQSQNITVYNVVEAPNITVTKIDLSHSSNAQVVQIIDQSTIHQFKTQIAAMGQLFQKENQLINNQYNNRYVELQNRHNLLIADYANLREQLGEVEEKNKEKQQSIIQSEKQSVNQIIEEIENVQNYQNIDQCQDQNSISEFTIQTLSQVLKKYQKQFTKFATLYESQLSKKDSNRLSDDQQNNFDNSRYLTIRKQISLLEGLLNQNRETIELLQASLNEKDTAHNEEINTYENEFFSCKKKIQELEMNLREAHQAMSELQGKHLKEVVETANKGQESGESLNTAFLMIDSKNKELALVRKDNLRISKELLQKNKQLQRLNKQNENRSSPLELQEQAILRQLIVQQNLPEILKSCLAHLTESEQIISES